MPKRNGDIVLPPGIQELDEKSKGRHIAAKRRTGGIMITQIPKTCSICGEPINDKMFAFELSPEPKASHWKCHAEKHRQQQPEEELCISFANGVLTVGGVAMSPHQMELCLQVAASVAEEACREFEKHDGSTYADEVRKYFGLIPKNIEEDY